MSNHSTDTSTLLRRAAVVSLGNVAAVLLLWKIKLKKKAELNHQTTSEETKNIWTLI